MWDCVDLTGVHISFMEQIQAISDEAFLRTLEGAGPDRLCIQVAGLGRSRLWDSGPRSLPDQVLWFFIRGGVEGTVADETDEVRIPEGSFHWLSGGVGHHLHKTEERQVMRNFNLRFVLRSQDGEVVTPRWRRLLLPDFPPGRLWLEQAYLTWQAHGAFQFEKMRALLVVLWIDMLKERERQTQPRSGRHQFTAGEISELLRHVEANLHRPFLQIELARMMELTPDYFARKFRATFKMAPREWLTRQRLKRAATLLIETRLRVQEIAAETGYADPRFFARQFHKQFGEQPSVYRSRR